MLKVAVANVGILKKITGGIGAVGPAVPLIYWDFLLKIGSQLTVRSKLHYRIMEQL